VLLGEMDDLAGAGVDVSGLRLSFNAHLIMPYHLEMEKVTERFLGKNALGTTKRGIGPAYADRASRVGIRVQDLYDEKIFREKLEVVLKEKNQILTKVYGRLAIPIEGIVEDYVGYAERLRPYVADTTKLLHEALTEGRQVLLEGAQGAMLDLDHGTYPFVTSSNPIASGAATGIGIGPTRIDRVLGVSKAYVTRVGEGPFPSEIEGPQQAQLRELGGEFGTVTGRERRCGWLDLVALRYAVRVNGMTSLALTKLDVLSDFAELPVCVRYRLPDGTETEHFPAHQSDFHHARPVWETLPGWQQTLDGVSALDDLPGPAREYVEFVSRSLELPIELVGVGAARERVLA
jgi:adenylosuccinate synthase